MKKYLIFLLISFFLLFSKPVKALEINRYVNIVNPVRGRNLWRSVESVQRQIDLITEYKLPSTWLLQYDVINDDTASTLFRKLPANQELGILLEVDEKLATNSYAAYLLGEGGWWRADKVLLSGYSPEDRKRMIDKVFAKFKEEFGYYPKSIGVWYIDTLSLDYIAKKYHIQAIMDVADQYQTDTYGVWGKPWGTPYYPSKFNSLLPAKNFADKLDVVKIQWAARDPVRGYGLTVAESTFSVQANDYSGHNLNMNYFKKLSKAYLFSPNSLTQLTVGIEAGQEGATFFDEYKRQIQFLAGLEREERITFRTMASFAQEFRKQYPKVSPGFLIYSDDYSDSAKEAFWYSNADYRIGLIKKDHKLIVQDFRVYLSPFIYEDVFQKDTSHNLRRILPSYIDRVVDNNEKVMISNVDKIQVNREGENVVLSALDSDKREHKILLAEDDVIIDGKKFFTISQNRNDSKIFLSGKLIDYWTDKFHDWMGSWRFSNINGMFYFGFMSSPNTLVGINTKFPYIGVFTMPFQVLVRFKTFPEINIAKVISSNLVNRLNNSTIEIETQ